MAPAPSASTGVCCLPRSSRSCPTRSFTPLVALKMVESEVMVPEYTRNIVTLPA